MTHQAPPPYDGLSEARRLLRTIRAGTLATLQPDGFPLATLTTLASDFDGAPILLMSQLSTHTRNLDADGRCCLLLAQGGKGDPLAHPRLSLVGTAQRIIEKSRRAHLRQRFLNRNPKAALYADFSDFSFWRVEVQIAHLNGGFAKAADFSGGDIASPVANGLAGAEVDWLQRLNAEGGLEALALALAAGETKGPWRATGLDADGLDLACGDRTARVALPPAFAAEFGRSALPR